MTTEVQRSENFDFGRVVGGTTSLIGRNFVVFFVLAALLAGLPFAASMFLPFYLLEDQTGLAVWAQILNVIVSVITACVLQAALTRASIDDLSGKGVSLGAALGSGFRYFFPLIGLAILVGLGVGLGAVLLIVPGVILAVRWVVATPPIVVEDKGITEAMGRSADLTKGHRWPIFGLMMLYVVLNWALTAVAAMITGSFSQAILGDVGLYSLPAIGVLTLTQTLSTLIATVGVAAIYFELRRIKEGVDVADLASVFD